MCPKGVLIFTTHFKIHPQSPPRLSVTMPLFGESAAAASGRLGKSAKKQGRKDIAAFARNKRHAGAASDAPGAPGVSPAAHAQPGLCLVVAV